MEKNEYNQSFGGENPQQGENPVQPEARDVGEPQSGAHENSSAPELGTESAPAGREKREKKRGRLTQTLTSFAVATVAVVSVAAVSANGSVEAEILQLSVADTSLTYTVELPQDQGKELRVAVYNDFFRREAALTPGVTTGQFEGLKSNVSYRLAVVGNFGFGDKVIAEQSFRTKRPEELPRTEFLGLTYQCRCGVDGYFYFELDFIDQNNYYTAFEATLEDVYGTVMRCEFSGDPHARQRIEVGRLLGSACVLTVRCQTAEPGAADSQKTLFQQTVRI